MKYRRDATGSLEQLANKIIKQEPDYQNLSHLKFLFVWREGKPKKDHDGGYIAAEASVLPSKTRDLFGFDVQIEVNEEVWNRISPLWKERLIWHELRHFLVEMEEDESGKLIPVRDKENRISVSLIPHDISLKTFKAEIERFGVDSEEVGMMKFISQTYKKAKNGEIQKYARPTVFVEGLPEKEAEGQ